MRQLTIAKPVVVSGTDPFGGRPVKLEISPGEPDSGIVYVTDNGEVRATLANAHPFLFSMMLKKGDAMVAHPEHNLASLVYGCGIDNARIRIRNRLDDRILRRLGVRSDIDVIPNFPRLEQTLCEAVRSVGTTTQDQYRVFYRGGGTYLRGEKEIFSISQSSNSLVMDVTVDYEGMGMFQNSFKITPGTYIRIAGARGYGKFAMIRNGRIVPSPQLDTTGYDFGPSHGYSPSVIVLSSVLDREGSIKENALREIASHSVIDRLGEIALVGRVEGHVIANGAGHGDVLNALKLFTFTPCCYSDKARCTLPVEDVA